MKYLIAILFFFMTGLSTTVEATPSTGLYGDKSVSKGRPAPQGEDLIGSLRSVRGSFVRLEKSTVLSLPNEEMALDNMIQGLAFGFSLFGMAILESTAGIGNVLAAATDYGRLGWGIVGVLLGVLGSAITLAARKRFEDADIFWAIHIPVMLLSLMNIVLSSETNRQSQDLQVAPSVLLYRGSF